MTDDGNSGMRPDGLSIIAIWRFVIAGGALLSACALTIPISVISFAPDIERPARLFGTALMGLGLTFTLVIGAAFAAVGWGLWNMQAWARIAAIILAALQLLWFPVGSAAGALTIWFLVSNEAALAAFSVDT